ncbi:MAG: hypothetical protein ORN58_01555, partial [Sediminibacterium sp.]|nr:hypothetical protein [Sediminibacterium sp.]
FSTGVLLGFPTNTQIGYHSNGTDILINYPSNFDLTGWNHLALTFDGINLSLYINGVLADKRTGQSAIAAGTCTSNYIGRSNWNDVSTTGQFEDFRIWKVARDSTQIRQYMSTYPTGDGTVTGTALANLYYWLPLNQNNTRTYSKNILNNTSLANASNAAGANSQASTITSQNSSGASWNYDGTNKIIRGSNGTPLNTNEVIQVSTDNTFTTNVAIATFSAISNNFTAILPNGSSFKNGTIYGRVRNTTTNTTVQNFGNLEVKTIADTPKITSLIYGKGGAATNNLVINYILPITNGSTIVGYNALLVATTGNSTISSLVSDPSTLTITGLDNSLNYTLKFFAQTNIGNTDTVNKPINQLAITGITQVCENQMNVAFNFTPLSTPTTYTLTVYNPANLGGGLVGTYVGNSSPISITGLQTGVAYTVKLSTTYSNIQGVQYTINAADSIKTLTTLSAPNLNDTNLCIGKTIASLRQTYNGDSIKWYSTKSSGTILSTTTPINSSQSFFASQIIGGCETVNRDSIFVTILTLPTAPVVSNQRFNDGATIAQIVSTVGAGGNEVRFYLNLTGGIKLADTTKLVTQPYYATSLSLQGCESTPRTPFAVYLNSVPGIPTNVLDTATGVSGQVRVRFSAPSNNGGTTITKYVITATGGIKDSVCSTCPKTDITDVLNNGILINGLTNNSAYSFTVVAQNGVGYSASSASSALAVPVAEGINSYKAVSFKTSTIASTANSDNIKLPSIDLSNRDYTIETWFKYNESTVTSFKRIFDFGLVNSGAGTNVLLCLKNGTTVNNPTLFFFAGNTQQADITTNININNWNHFALTLSTTTAKLYINGVLVQTSAGARASGVFMSNFIGASNDGATS